jgi:Uma2 family endonuclease
MMSTLVSPPEEKFMTVEEFLAIPEDGISRELIRGELRERGMTTRNRFHGNVQSLVCTALQNWLDGRPEPRGEILSGETGFRLRGTKDSLVGIDVAYVSAELVAETDASEMIYNGPPILAVEILSPWDRHKDVVEKVALYHEAGVIVWEVDPDFRRVAVHRPGQPSKMFSGDDELTTEPELPGFRVRVSQLFKPRRA